MDTERRTDTLPIALQTAGEFAKDSIVYGMTCVVDTAGKYTVATYPAGCDPLTAQKISLEALSREEAREAAARKQRLEEAAAQTSGPAPVPDEAFVSQELAQFTKTLAERFPALESVSLTLAWKEGAGPLLGGYNAADGSLLRQAGVYRLLNAIKQMDTQLRIYQQQLSEEVHQLNSLFTVPQHDQQTTGPGTAPATDSSHGSAVGPGTQQSAGGDVYPRLYDHRETGWDDYGRRHEADQHEPGQASEDEAHWPNGYDGRNEPIGRAVPKQPPAEGYNPWFGGNGPPCQR